MEDNEEITEEEHAENMHVIQNFLYGEYLRRMKLHRILNLMGCFIFLIVMAIILYIIGVIR